jgi:hypothetical protein
MGHPPELVGELSAGIKGSRRAATLPAETSGERPAIAADSAALR